MRLKGILNHFVQIGFLVPTDNDNLVSDLEDNVGCKFPEDLHQYWSNYDPAEGHTIDWWHMVPVNNCQELRRAMRDAADLAGCDTLESPEETVIGAVRAVWWHDKWIPIFVSEHVMICVDLDPEKGGNVGQVVYLNDDGEDRVVLFESLEAMFRRIYDLQKIGDLELVSSEGMPTRLESVNSKEPLFYPR